MSINKIYSVENGTLLIKTPLFSAQFADVENASATEEDGAGLSMPYVNIKAEGAGRVRHYCVWEDLPVVYMPDYGEKELLTIKGEHWIARNVHLHAFTDDGDTLVDEDLRHMFARNIFYPVERNVSDPLTGNIFFLENPEDGNAIVIICETPDYETGSMKVEKGIVKIDAGTNAVALGFCKMGECEALVRNYYRHAKKPRPLVTMSNTWGDCNGFSRVCRDFVLREIDAGKELGVDIVQIDDGWQVGNTETGPLAADGRRIFLDNYWDLAEEKFPGTLKEMTDYAAKDGIKVGMWFAPDTAEGGIRLARDKEILRRAYNEWGIRFFKLDMYWIESDTDRDNFLDLLREIYSFGDDVAVQLDVTRYARINYLCGRQYGTIFVENRYLRSANSFPHRILRNLWMISKYIPSSKFQFELVNPDLFKENYNQDDPFRPTLFSMDYLFACVMLSNPLFWMEMQFLPQNRRDELKGIMDVWKACREELSRADVMPIGEKPSGRSFPGFYISVDGKQKYLLLFREVTEKDSTVITAPVQTTEAKVLASNADVSVKVLDGAIQATFSQPRAYAFIEL